MKRIQKAAMILVAGIVLLQICMPVAAGWYSHPPWEYSSWVKAGSPSKSYVFINTDTGKMGVKVLDVGYARTCVGYEPIWVPSSPTGPQYTIYDITFRGYLDAYLKAPAIGYAALEVWVGLIYEDGSILDYDIVFARSAWWSHGYEVDEYFATHEYTARVSDFYATEQYYIVVFLYGISSGIAGGRVVKDAGTTNYAELTVYSIYTDIYYQGPKG
jgi:hypothetical protein